MKFSIEQTKDWICWDRHDWETYPGIFIGVAGEWEHGPFNKLTKGLNYEHSYHTWIRENRVGKEAQHCDICGQGLRYSNIFVDPNGGVHEVGNNCLHFLNSKLPEREYREKRFREEIRIVHTKNGNRAVYQIPSDVPDWYWDMEKEKRPAMVSLSKNKWFNKWVLSVWGMTEQEVFDKANEFLKIDHEMRKAK